MGQHREAIMTEHSQNRNVVQTVEVAEQPPILANMCDCRSSSRTAVALLPYFIDDSKVPSYRHCILMVRSKSQTLVTLR